MLRHVILREYGEEINNVLREPVQVEHSNLRTALVTQQKNTSTLSKDDVEAEVLLDRMAKINSLCNTLLLLTTQGRYNAMLGELLEYITCVEVTDTAGYTPLMWSATQGNEDFTRLLLDKGANVNATSRDNDTPLSAAVQKGYQAIVKMLLEYGANVEVVNHNGHRPLLIASQNGNQALVEILLNHNADMEVANDAGRTPLMCSTISGHKDVVRLLIANGAKLNVIDKNNNTALILAIDQKATEIV
ncbi:hypothetical protein VE03_10529 [Pseudogymnoascus sp. 23342-1-I1]|nr:hypothetical protein VE03_10529 [Pseudogymnoascus sp. 23342-1-I1]